MLSPKRVDLVKRMKQWLQLLNIFFSREWPLPDLSSRICLSASLHVSVVPDKLRKLVWFADERAGFSLLQHL